MRSISAGWGSGLVSVVTSGLQFGCDSGEVGLGLLLARHLAQLGITVGHRGFGIDDLRVQTPSGYVPIGNFVERIPTPRVGYINRVGGNRYVQALMGGARGVGS